ncbi:hypothetical protein JW935_15995 [candidate division KSB1 bacterium]|nr:hypothetical protein [candidate division KSB1 bacterium]
MRNLRITFPTIALLTGVIVFQLCCKEDKSPTGPDTENSSGYFKSLSPLPQPSMFLNLVLETYDWEYPPTGAFLDACDKYGIYVEVESVEKKNIALHRIGIGLWT